MTSSPTGPLVVRVGKSTSSSLILSTVIWLGLVRSSHVFTFSNQGCSAIHPKNMVMEFADNTTVLGRRCLTKQCSKNNLVLNISKTVELIVDQRKSTHLSAYVGEAVKHQVHGHPHDLWPLLYCDHFTLGIDGRAAALLTQKAEAERMLCSAVGELLQNEHWEAVYTETDFLKLTCLC